MINRVHIVGRKNHGKTTLLVQLIDELSGRGLRVGAIKHSRHVHELDSPGSDSCRHREGGAVPAAIVSGHSMGIYLPCDPEAYWHQLAPLYQDCDVVLVEGDLDADGQKVEVWRAAAGTSCLARERSDIAVVVSDDLAPVDVPVFPRTDLEPLVQYILTLVSRQRCEVSK